MLLFPKVPIVTVTPFKKIWYSITIFVYALPLDVKNVPFLADDFLSFFLLVLKEEWCVDQCETGIFNFV